MAAIRVIGSPILHGKALDPVEAAAVEGSHAVAEVYGRGRQHQVVGTDRGAGARQPDAKGRVYSGDLEIEGYHRQRFEPAAGKPLGADAPDPGQPMKAVEHLGRSDRGYRYGLLSPVRRA